MFNKNELSSKFKKESLDRIYISIILLISILPILIISSIPSFGGSFKNYLLPIFTMVLFVLISVELNNFLFPIKDSKINFLISIFVSAGLSITLYCLLVVDYFILNKGFKWIYPIIFGITAVSLIIGSCFFDEIPLVNVLILFLLHFLIGMFLFFISHNGVNLNWNILFYPIVITIFVDLFSYIGGKYFGKTKVFKKTSPNKTTEGLFIGAIAGVIIGIIWFYGFINPIQFRYSIIYSPPGLPDGNPVAPIIQINYSALLVILSIFASIAGDLFFSKIKRIYWKKDYSNILKSHGGLLDRIDSHIFSTIIFSSVFLLLVN